MFRSKWSKIAMGVGVLGVAFSGVQLAKANTLPGLPPEKQAMEDRMAADQAKARALGANKADSPPAPQPSSKPPTPLPTGIFEEKQAPFPPSQIRVNNRWQGTVNGQEVIVFAGMTHDNQGVVVVLNRKDGHLADMNSYNAPVKSGLRVTAENNGQLTLQSENGSTFTFDVSSRSF
jgi:hypothetical protein